MEVVGAYNACAPPACSHSRSQNRALSEKPRLLQGTHTHIYTHVNTNTNAQREGGLEGNRRGAVEVRERVEGERTRRGYSTTNELVVSARGKRRETKFLSQRKSVLKAPVAPVAPTQKGPTGRGLYKHTYLNTKGEISSSCFMAEAHPLLPTV